MKSPVSEQCIMITYSPDHYSPYCGFGDRDLESSWVKLELGYEGWIELGLLNPTPNPRGVNQADLYETRKLTNNSSLYDLTFSLIASCDPQAKVNPKSILPPQMMSLLMYIVSCCFAYLNAFLLSKLRHTDYKSEGETFELWTQNRSARYAPTKPS